MINFFVFKLKLYQTNKWNKRLEKQLTGVKNVEIGVRDPVQNILIFVDLIAMKMTQQRVFSFHHIPEHTPKVSPVGG